MQMVFASVVMRLLRENKFLDWGDRMDEELEKRIRYEARSELKEHERTPIEEDLKIYETIRSIIESARTRAKRAVNTEMVQAYWQVSKAKLMTKIEFATSFVANSIFSFLSNPLQD